MERGSDGVVLHKYGCGGSSALAGIGSNLLAEQSSRAFLHVVRITFTSHGMVVLGIYTPCRRPVSLIVAHILGRYEECQYTPCSVGFPYDK
jgi:hypothetical protein